MEEINVEVLANEAIKLLRMEIDDLYATLGGQLLGQNLPTRVAGVVSYLSALRSASDAKSFYEALPPGPALIDWGSGLGVIYEELKKDGMRFMEKVHEDLRKAVCNEDILHLSATVNRSTMQVVVMVVGATLRLPREFEPISVTVAAILFKLGLRNFCRRSEAGDKEPPVE